MIDLEEAKCFAWYEYIEKTYRGVPVVTKKDLNYVFCIPEPQLTQFLHNVCEKKKDYALLKGNKYISRIQPKKKLAPRYGTLGILMVVFPSGFKKICDHFGLDYYKLEKFAPACIEYEKKISSGDHTNAVNHKQEETIYDLSLVRREQLFSSLVDLLDGKIDVSGLQDWMVDAIYETGKVYCKGGD